LPYSPECLEGSFSELRLKGLSKKFATGMSRIVESEVRKNGGLYLLRKTDPGRVAKIRYTGDQAQPGVVSSSSSLLGWSGTSGRG
jgi:hypothetical protein